MRRVRGSFITQIAACSASAVQPALRIVSNGGEPAWLGDAVHESQAIYVSSGEIADVTSLAKKHRVDEDELGYLCHAGRKSWDAIKQWVPNPRCEEEFTWIDEESQILLTGHPDVYSANLDNLVVADWKSGFLWADCEPQLRAYAWLISQQFPVKVIDAIHVNIRRGEIEPFRWTYDELADWWREMAERINEGHDTYSPGYEACRYCPRWRECPAGLDLAADAVRLISLDDSSVLSEATVAAYQRAKFVEKVAREVVENIRTLVAQAGGTFDRLEIDREKRDKIDAHRGWKEMVASVGVIETLDACTVGKTKLLDAVRKNAPKRGGKKAADDLMERLRAAGAVSETFVEKLELRKAPKVPCQVGTPESAGSIPATAETKLIEQTV